MLITRPLRVDPEGSEHLLEQRLFLDFVLEDEELGANIRIIVEILSI